MNYNLAPSLALPHRASSSKRNCPRPHSPVPIHPLPVTRTQSPAPSHPHPVTRSRPPRSTPLPPMHLTALKILGLLFLRSPNPIHSPPFPRSHSTAFIHAPQFTRAHSQAPDPRARPPNHLTTLNTLEFLLLAPISPHSDLFIITLQRRLFVTFPLTSPPREYSYQAGRRR